MNIIQIVPRLPPAIDGVGDYALNLADQLYKDFSIKTHFFVGDVSWTGAANIGGFPVNKLTANSASELLYKLSVDTDINIVLLHYVGYGYAKRGCPVWLVEGLENWKFGCRDTNLVTMFHEISACGPIWTSSFWLSRLQINLATRLVRLSDRVITSKQLYAEILYKLSLGKHKEIPTLPVFSNIGEPKKILPLAERQPQLVVFGGRSNRMQLYQNSLVLLSRTCELLGIDKILDIGSPINLSVSSIKNISIIKIGQQSTTKISDILSNSQVGFLNYNPKSLAKSGIFAAYSAHGLLPVNAQWSALLIDGIEAKKHYWFPNKQTIDYKNVAKLQAIADNAYIWYESHKLSVQAQTFVNLLARNVVIKLGNKS